MAMEAFQYKPQWQGPLPGRSFEQQTEDAINALIETVNAISGGAVPSDALPKAPGTAYAGSSAEFSRGDHRHPPQNAVSGNAGTATRLQTARTISLSGDASGSASFDGSGDAAIVVDIPDASSGQNGLMSAEDKAKLDELEVLHAISESYIDSLFV